MVDMAEAQEQLSKEVGTILSLQHVLFERMSRR
ncbi:hypothetical protein BDE02_19G075500 [Populus trichocarpa]|nr:hypothetical protein BDE02_19G075500 [Populus trichocarpa]